MEEKSSIYSSFFLVQARRRKGKEEENKKERNQGMKFLYGKYGNYYKPYLIMGC